MEDGHEKYSSVSGVLFNKDKTELIKYPGGKEGPYTIPDSVVDIDMNAFFFCYGLTSLKVHWHDQYDINNLMCDRCPNLTEIIILDSDKFKSIDGSIYEVKKEVLSLTGWITPLMSDVQAMV